MLSSCRERLSWRCVGRRREEPAARRRATNGPIRRPRGSAFRARVQKSTKPLAALHRSSGQRRSTWVAACAVLVSGGLRRGSRSQASAFVKTMQSTHQRRLDRKQQVLLARLRAHEPLLLLVQSRGLCRPVASLVDFRLARVENARAYMEPLDSSGKTRAFRTLRVTPHPNRVENSRS